MTAPYTRHPDAPDSVYSGLDLLSVPPTQTSVLSGRWNRYSPSAPLSDTGTIEFTIPASNLQYIDLAETWVELEIQITKANGTVVHATATDDINIWPTDNMASSIFRSAELFLNDQLVEYVQDYPFRAYVETLLNFSREAKKSTLKTRGWFEDALSAKNAAADADAVVARKRTILGSRKNNFFTQLHLSFLNIDKLLFPGNTIKLKLERSNPSFCLSAATDTPGEGGMVKITKCHMFVRHVTVNPSIQEAHNQALLNSVSTKYPIERVKTSFHTLSPGTTSEERVVQTSGQLPDVVFVAFPNHVAVSGSFNTNPFRFDHHDIRSLSLMVDGELVGDPFEPRFGEGKYAREYVRAMTAGREGTLTEGLMTPEEYADGRTVFGFDLRGDLTDGVHLIKNGAVTVNVSFGTPTRASVALYVYTVRSDTVEIDLERRVHIAGDSIV